MIDTPREDGDVADFGLSFDCELTFAEILERLNQLGPWSWYERDSAWFGNLASARTDTVRLDLVESGPTEVPGGSVDAGNGQPFAISVRAGRGQPPDTRAWSAIEKRIREVVLPELGATRVQPTDPID